MARSRRQWGSVRSRASGRSQARYLDPDTLTAEVGDARRPTQPDASIDALPLLGPG